MKPLAIAAALTMLLMPALAIAETPTVVNVTPIPEGRNLGEISLSPWVESLGPAVATAIYDNTASISTQYYNQGGFEILDDLNGVGSGPLASVTIACYSPNGPTDATFTIYENDASDSFIGAALAGPYNVSLPAGGNLVTINVPSGPLVGPDMWFGISFSDVNAGLILANPPTVGSSSDYFYDSGSAGLAFFGGAPVANFGIRVTADLMTPVEEVTWGGIKKMMSGD